MKLCLRALSIVAISGLAGCHRDAHEAPPKDAEPQVAETAVSAAAVQSNYRIRLNQLGYLPDGERFAMVLSSGMPAPHYRIIESASRRVVAEGTAGPRVLETTSRAGSPLVGDRIDLRTVESGDYVIVLQDGSRSDPLHIGKNAYAPVLPLVTQFLSEQRCGPTSKQVSLHDACHLRASIPAKHSGDGVVVEDGAKPPYSKLRIVDAEGGWHDAGDYIKFVGTTAYMLAVELMAIRDHRAALGGSGEALAQELRWGLDWLLKMEGGPELYHQVGGEGDHDPGWRLPEGDTEHRLEAYDHRPVFRMAPGHGRNLLGRSAAAFAYGSQVYASDTAYAQRLLAAAKSTYASAKARPKIQNPDPPNFYEETSGEDDLVFAAAALARVTSDAKYANDAHTLGMALAPRIGVAVSWNSVDALGLLEAARAMPEGSAARAELTQRLLALAAPIARMAQTPTGPGAPFGYALPAFGNGSIAESLGAAATCLAAKRAAGLAGCDAVARRQMHWMLGQNPFGVSFLVGAGTESPKNIHHSFAQAAHASIPGAIPGGPTNLHELVEGELPAPPKDDPYSAWSTDELLYEDRADNYICNEPAIDFTAALVFTLAELTDP